MGCQKVSCLVTFNQGPGMADTGYRSTPPKLSLLFRNGDGRDEVRQGFMAPATMIPALPIRYGTFIKLEQ